MTHSRAMTRQTILFLIGQEDFFERMDPRATCLTKAAANEAKSSKPIFALNNETDLSE